MNSTPPHVFQRLDRSASRPWTRRQYAGRMLWHLVEITLFRFSLPRAYGWRRFLLRQFGAKMGVNSCVRRTVRIWHPWLLQMDDFSMLGDDVQVYNLGEFSIGQHSIVSQQTYICAGTHDYTRVELPLVREPVRIGHGVWVAAQAFVGPGVSIGDNSVIGARAVLVSDIPAGVVAAGNPAWVIKPRAMTANQPSPGVPGEGARLI
jgi:putative colanic acid biosynthesis acetyltransferase WcaF